MNPAQDLPVQVDNLAKSVANLERLVMETLAKFSAVTNVQMPQAPAGTVLTPQVTPSGQQSAQVEGGGDEEDRAIGAGNGPQSARTLPTWSEGGNREIPPALGKLVSIIGGLSVSLEWVDRLVSRGSCLVMRTRGVMTIREG